MKTFLVLLLIFISLSGQSQSDWGSLVEFDSTLHGFISSADILVLDTSVFTTFYERQNDTIDVILLVCDTSEVTTERLTFTHGEFVNNSYVDYFKTDTIHTGIRNHSVFWRFGKEVRELHNTSEGQIDPGMCPDCWHDYWQHVKYIDEIGNDLPKEFIVWDAKVIKEIYQKLK